MVAAPKSVDFMSVAAWTTSRIPSSDLNRARVRCGVKGRVSASIPSGASARSILAASSARLGEAAMPHQKARGRCSLGKNPIPRKWSSTGCVVRIEERAFWIGSDFSFPTWPMNFRVMWRFSGRIQRAVRDFGWSFVISSVIAWRTGSGKSSATKRRTGLRPAAREEKIAAHGIESGLRRVHADTFAVAGEFETAFTRASFVGDADVHEADGFLRSAAARACNSRDAYADRRARSLADAVGESQRHFGAYRAFRLDQLCRDIDQGGFQFIAVANDAAEKVDGASGNICEAFGEEAACAAFGDGDCGTIFRERARDNFLHCFAFGGIEMLAEREGHALHHFVENLIGLGGIARPDARVKLNSRRRRENCGFGVGVKRVEGRDALLDF